MFVSSQRSRATGLLVCFCLIALSCSKGDAPPGISLAERSASQAVPPREEPIGPEPEMVLPVDPFEVVVKTIFLDATHMYFDIRPGGIHRVPRNDTRREQMELVAPSGGGGQFLLDEVLVTLVHDSEANRGRMHEVNKATLETRIVDLPDIGYYQVSTLDDDYFYAVGIGCANPSRVARVGGGEKVLEFPPITEGGGPRLVVDDEHLYCTNDFTMIRMNKDLSTPPEVLLADQGYYQFVHGAGEYLVWMQEGEPGTRERSLVSHIYEMSKQDLLPMKLGSTDTSVSSGYVYEHETECWYFMRAGRNHGYVGFFCPSTGYGVVSNERSIGGGIAVDDEYVYWGEYDGIKRVPNPAPR